LVLFPPSSVFVFHMTASTIHANPARLHILKPSTPPILQPQHPVQA
jgi:hypothetical protein